MFYQVWSQCQKLLVLSLIMTKCKWEIVHSKWKFCHHLLTIMLLKTWMSFYFVLNTKEDIWKNIGNQTVAGSHWLPCFFCRSQWLPSTVGILRNIFFRWKKLIEVWNNMRMRIFSFVWTVPLNCKIISTFTFYLLWRACLVIFAWSCQFRHHLWQQIVLQK